MTVTSSTESVRTFSHLRTTQKFTSLRAAGLIMLNGARLSSELTMMFHIRQFIVSSRAKDCSPCEAVPLAVWSDSGRAKSLTAACRRERPLKTKSRLFIVQTGFLFFMTSFVYFAYFVWLGCLMCAAPKTEPATAAIIPTKTRYPPTLVYPKIGVTGLV